VRADRSAARPRSVVDLGATRTKGARRPRPWEGSNAVPMSLSAVGSWGAVMKGASGCPARRLPGLYGSTGNAGVDRSRGRTCLYDSGRLESVDILFEVIRSTVGVRGVWRLASES
jgi:hypothetical protein